MFLYHNRRLSLLEPFARESTPDIVSTRLATRSHFSLERYKGPETIHAFVGSSYTSSVCAAGDAVSATKSPRAMISKNIEGLVYTSVAVAT